VQARWSGLWLAGQVSSSSLLLLVVVVLLLMLLLNLF
jgi:hypothetical protein